MLAGENPPPLGEAPGDPRDGMFEGFGGIERAAG